MFVVDNTGANHHLVRDRLDRPACCVGSGHRNLDRRRRVRPRLPTFITGDIVKGSLSVDPDGFPLIYSGSRDGKLRILAFDRPEELVELWSLSGDDVSPVMWNDDWDGAPLILKDHLITGGENSWLHIVRLNRELDDSGLVSVDPEIVFQTPGWDDELLRAIGDNNVSIENSVTI